MQFYNLGSLITYHDANNQETCLGFLLVHQDKVYDPNLGRVEVDPQFAGTHNTLLSKAGIEGLDQNCGIGQGGYFYKKDKKIVTFTGDQVGTISKETARKVTFTRNGKTFTGTKSKDHDCIFFTRTE